MELLFKEGITWDITPVHSLSVIIHHLLIFFWALFIFNFQSLGCKGMAFGYSFFQRSLVSYFWATLRQNIIVRGYGRAKMFIILKNQRALHTTFSTLQKKQEIEILDNILFLLLYSLQFNSSLTEDKNYDFEKKMENLHFFHIRKWKSELFSSLLQFVKY